MASFAGPSAMSGASGDDSEAPVPPEPEVPSLEDRQSWIEDWMIATATAREESSRDERYYYGKQWSREELDDLKKRGQPPIVDNLIRRKVNTVRGEEIEKRVDPVAKPRTPNHEDEARAITDALRFVEEDQYVDEMGGDCLLDALVAGIFGGIVESDEEDGYRCLVQHVPWTQLAIDPRSRRRDGEDARWKANIQWLDLDDAIDTYPEAEEALREAVNKHIGAGDDATEDRPKKWYDGKRQRVKVVEMYLRLGKVWYRTDFTQGQDLRAPAPSVYLDPRTGRPWCPLLIYRVYVDEENNAHGPVRDMISPQDEINKRKSKSLHLLAVDQMIYEEGAVLDPQKAQQQRAEPDGAIMVQPGALNERRVLFERNLDLVQGQVAMLQEAKQALDAVGGASATLPDLPQSASGVAFARRQKSASRELGPVFEIFGKFRLALYWHVWGCIRQFWTDELWLRVTDDETSAGYRFVGLNRRMTRGQRLQELLQKGLPLPAAIQAAAGKDAQGVISRVQQLHQAMAQQAIAFGMAPPGGDQHLLQMVLQDPAMQAQMVENDVAAAMVDITIHEAPESAVLEEEEFGKLADFAGTASQLRPDLAPVLAELLIESSAFRSKRKLLERVRQPPDPQQQQMQQAAQALQLEGVKAGIGVQQTQAQLNAARAEAERVRLAQSGAKVPSEVQRNEAAAMRDAATAGKTVGSGGSPWD